MSESLAHSAGLDWMLGLVAGLATALALALASTAALTSALERRSRARRLASAAALAGLAAEARPSLIVVLGCPPRTRSGSTSRYLSGRAQAAADAFHALETVPILCSGSGHDRQPGSPGLAEGEPRSPHSNDTTAPDEVRALAFLLEAARVPRDAIRLDRAARRTIDTIDHLAARHAGERILLVTQSFHLPRTLFLANARALDAWGLSAPGPRPGLRVQVREGLGQLRAVWDVARARLTR